MRTKLLPQSLFFIITSLFLMHCSDQDAENVAVSGVKIQPSAISIDIGEKEYLGAIITPDNATNKTLTWSSNNVDIADVNDQGIVSAKALGSAIITATSANGKNATCSITVEQQSSGEVSVESVSLDRQSIILEMGDTEILFASVSPNNAINKTVQWSTSDENVATVNQNGVVTPVSGGIAEITITSVDGGFKASCEVKIPCDNIIPIMTNNTSPSGKATCSSSANVIINGTLAFSKPYLAFDGDSQTKWASKNDLTNNSFKEWIEYEFDIPISINKYKFIPYDDGNGNYPNTFYLQAYDNASETWINLHSDQNITDSNPKNYSFTNNNKYYKYRLYVTKTNTQIGRIRHISIFTLEMGFDAH